MFDEILGIEDLDFIEENFARAGWARPIGGKGVRFQPHNEWSRCSGSNRDDREVKRF